MAMISGIGGNVRYALACRRLPSRPCSNLDKLKTLLQKSTLVRLRPLWNRERQRQARHQSWNLLDNRAGRCRSRFQRGRSRLHSSVDVLLFCKRLSKAYRTYQTNRENTSFDIKAPARVSLTTSPSNSIKPASSKRLKSSLYSSRKSTPNNRR